MTSERPGLGRRTARGAIAALAFAPSILVLGVIFGASAGQAGISRPAAVLMSLVVFSGAGQFASLPLWPQGGTVIVLSTLALSLRFALMTTSLAPLLTGQPRWLRAILAYMVTDENYALAIARSARRKEGKGNTFEPAFLAGAWIPLYVAWAAGTVAGVLVGAKVPPEWVGPLKAVFPLVFLVLTAMLCTSATLALVAVLGAALSVAGVFILPAGWNVIVAGLLASLAGPPLERLLGRPRPPKVRA